MSDVSTLPEDHEATEGPRAKWYVIAFHYQMAFLLICVIISLGIVPFFAPPMVMPRWAIGVRGWLIRGFPVIAVPVLGYLAIRIFRYTRWLRGVGGYNHPIIGPPPRANCVAIGVLLGGGGIFEGLNVAIAAGANPLLGLLLIVAGLWGIVFSLCGFLWARDAAQSEEQSA